MVVKFSEKEIDNLLQAVEETLTKAEVLTKSNLKKEEPAKESDDTPPPAPAGDDMPPPAAPATDSAPPPAPTDAMPPPAAPAADQPPQADAHQEPDGDEGVPPAAPAAEGDQAIADESAPLSDEELNQIYGSMDPAELERHYMVIRQHLQGAYAKMEAGKEVKITDDKANGGTVVAKSEDKVIALEKENADMKKQMDLLSKAIQVLATPKRKAVTSLAFIKKNEAQEGAKEVKMTKSEIMPKLNELTKSSKLSSSDRHAINRYCMYGQDEKQVIEIIKKSEGGK